MTGEAGPGVVSIARGVASKAWMASRASSSSPSSRLSRLLVDRRCVLASEPPGELVAVRYDSVSVVMPPIVKREALDDARGCEGEPILVGEDGAWAEEGHSDRTISLMSVSVPLGEMYEYRTPCATSARALRTLPLSCRVMSTPCSVFFLADTIAW